MQQLTGRAFESGTWEGESELWGRQEEGLQNETPVFGSVGQRTFGSDDRESVSSRGTNAITSRVQGLSRVACPIVSATLSLWCGLRMAVGGIPRTIRKFSFDKNIGCFIIWSIPGIP